MAVLKARENSSDTFTPVSMMGVGNASQSQRGLMTAIDKCELNALSQNCFGIDLSSTDIVSSVADMTDTSKEYILNTDWRLYKYVNNMWAAQEPLRDTITNLNNSMSQIGTVYGGSFPNKSIPKTTTTEIASITVPKGTYIVIGNHQWSESFNTVYVDMFSSCSIRNNANSGGGATISEIFVADSDNTTINYRTYQGTDANKTASQIRLLAIKLA